MLSFSGALKVFVALEPVDLRKSFSGLEGLVSERLGEDLRQGALFVFTNRRHSRLKILYWDGTGLWLLIKKHAPHCPHRKYFADPLSLPPTLRARTRSVRCCRGAQRHRLCPVAEPHDPWRSGLDV